MNGICLRTFTVTYWLADGEHQTTVEAVDRKDAEQRVGERFTEPTLCLCMEN